MTLYDYDTTASNNSSVGGAGAEQSDTPKNADNSFRGLAAELAQHIRDMAGANTVGGTADAITITPASGAISALFDGLAIVFRAGATNTITNPTAAVGGLTAKTLKKFVNGAESALAIGDVVNGGTYMVMYRSAWASAAGAFQLIDLNHNVPGGDNALSLNLTVKLILNADDGNDTYIVADNSSNISLFIDNVDAADLSESSGTPLLTWKGNIALGDGQLQRPEIKDYSITHSAIGAIGGGTQDLDLEVANSFSATVDTSETTFTFSNPPASGKQGSFTLELTNGGSQTVNWPASVDWESGVAPVLTTSGVDILTFVTRDGGTTWYGFAIGLDMQ